MRKSQVPVIFFLEPWFGVIGSSFFGSFAISNISSKFILLFLFIHFLIWFTSDFFTLKVLRLKVNNNIIIVWLLRELLAFPMWLHCQFGNSVMWRGKLLTIQPGGLLEEENHDS